MTHKESEPDDRALRPRTDGLIVIDLGDEAAKLAQTGTSNGRQALESGQRRTTQRSAYDAQKGAESGEHRRRGPITVHVLSGVIRFHTESRQVTLAARCMLALDRDVANSVTALEDSSVLLTTAIA